MTGTIESIWRYPVKSMRGEAVDAVFTGYSGLIGDRLYAIRSDSRAERFPWFTGRQYPDLIRHVARYRMRESTLQPSNPEASHPDLPDDAVFEVEVETPQGVLTSPGDPMFLAGLPAKDGETLSLVYSPRNFADVAPVSLISMQTVAQLGEEIGADLDKLRFRANFYVDWERAGGFQEDKLVGRRVRIGETLELSVLERDDRCKMITLDPDTGEQMPDLLKHLLAARDGCAGVYAAVLREGVARPGDAVEILES